MNRFLIIGLGVGAFVLAYLATKFIGSPRDPALEAVAHTPAPPPDSSADMVWIPGGEFTMGTDSKEAWPDEKPAHRVRVNGFWMDKTEVTNGSSTSSSRRRAM